MLTNLAFYPCESIEEGVLRERAIRDTHADAAVRVTFGDEPRWFVWQNGELLATFRSDVELARYLDADGRSARAPRRDRVTLMLVLLDLAIWAVAIYGFIRLIGG